MIGIAKLLLGISVEGFLDLCSNARSFIALR